MNKIRWGIVGPGFIANKFAQAVKNVECAELCAVASRSEEKGREFAAKYDIPFVFCGYDAMAASDKIDAVYIATPHPFHQPCAELFMNAGKHVLCEKPLCVNAAQARSLKESANKNGVFCMEAMWTRFLPALNDICDIVKSGVIGDVMALEADFCYDIDEPEDPKVFDNALAGGSLLDVGVYGLHFASLFFGSKPVSVSSEANVAAGVDRHINILLKYDNGAIANIGSAINLYKPETATVYGRKGFIVIPKFYSASEYTVVKDGNAETFDHRYIGNGFEEEIYEVCRCINADKTESDVLPLDESIAMLELMDTIRGQCGIVYPFD